MKIEFANKISQELIGCSDFRIDTDFDDDTVTSDYLQCSISKIDSEFIITQWFHDPGSYERPPETWDKEFEERFKTFESALAKVFELYYINLIQNVMMAIEMEP